MHSSTSPVRKAAAELVGTAALVAVVVGSGIQAAGLTRDTGVQLLANSLASAIGLGLLIALFGPVSGGHLNPVVTLSAWWLGRRDGSGPGTREALAYVLAQTAGAVAGALLAEAMFGRAQVVWSTQERTGGRLLLGEVVATAGLVLLICGLNRIGRPQLAPVAVAAYIAAAIWFTSSGSFANPAASVGRAFTDSFTGISPGSLPGFITAQLAGGALGLALAALLYGKPGGQEESGVREGSRGQGELGGQREVGAAGEVSPGSAGNAAVRLRSATPRSH
ncbi:aquaporin [Streptomyces indicus]|uniref:Glycerol uptake facilitator (Major Intrinsic Protein Family) n=1 Tax=Streptomyces indicus TaxID=417292 RepID=A0A1G9EX35_9ACTN|nr:aquaporin [Streptomyces indicus]SDK80653.1 Glycerol uptake facilitator (Major Intrinsic Protein Family) [Streptomyces indicus]